MQKTASVIFITISLLLLLGVFVFSSIVAQEPDTPLPKGPEPTPNSSTVTPTVQIDPNLLPKIEPQLLKKLLESENDSASFIIYLKTQTDVATIAAPSTNLKAQGQVDPVEKRAAIVNALQQTARDTQAGVLQALNNPSAGGGVGVQSFPVTEVKSLWIINAVAAKGSLETVLTLAARSDVEVIRLDKEIKISDPISPHSNFYNINTQFFQQPRQSPEWGISKIRADLVHNALGIDGTGVVVANMDTGVDGFHPALQANYRGYNGPDKLLQHEGNWYDATGQGAVYPVDANGHGSHTMGTMVGQNGIGVAPGAKWIAVRVFDSFGSAQNSWIHEAFQWILAPKTTAKPNGDSSLAPHIVNNSWGSDYSASTEFEADIQALLNGGVYPIFSAGNNGPNESTVGSPGSNNSAFAVGATTLDDEITNFSSRGPSPWGQIKPEVSAPGKDILSSLPGGAYGTLNGTSMAAPHTSGLAALLIQASPALTNNLDNISNIIKSTAIPLGGYSPNNAFGWGRIDAYNAVMAVASAGTLQGTVTQAGSGSPINETTIQITSHSTDTVINTSTNSSGNYIQGLRANTYDVTASAFEYESSTAFGLVLVTSTVTTQNFGLVTKATGTLSGTVRDKTSNAPLAATIFIDGTPASTTTNPVNGSYKLNLPTGVYTVTVVALQHRITQAINITINDGATVKRDFLLDSAPSILLVDSGKWYQESQINYYQQTLDNLLYPYDTWQITKPFANPNDIPTAATLSNYDIVIWSSPEDSPGYIGANDIIEDYLDGGGKLLLSGQDIAFFDGGGYFFGQSPYLKNYLKAGYVQDNSGIKTINALNGGPFEGLSLSILGGDGADNQGTPDVIANTDTDFAASLFEYQNGQLAALHIGLCLPYRALFLAFGFEAINNQADRNQVMSKAIDWLIQTQAPVGAEIVPQQETLIGNFDSNVEHTLRLRNIGTSSDVFNLTLTNIGPYYWTSSTVPAAVALDSCQSQNLNVNVHVSITKSWHISDSFRLTAQSTNNPTFSDTATRTTKTPAPVLLVDDDRWYSFADEMEESLEINNIPYDYWYVPKSWTGPVPPSPSLEILQMYPMIVWYTAYDWYQPLTSTEEDRLIEYLNNGGRLFFSSQDYLYRHLQNHGGVYAEFSQNYLGVLKHQEDIASTSITGQQGNVLGTHLGPYPLTFPPGYNNWTDALTPTTAAQIATVGQNGQANGIINAGVGSSGKHWHTTFLSYGPELLNSYHRSKLMQRSTGWLSWLGSSSIKPNVSASLDGQQIIYTATINNNGWYDLQTAHFTATFPAELTPANHSPELTSAAGNLVWSGPVAQNQSQVLTYTATIANALPLGTLVSQTSWLAYPDHNILFDRITDIKVNFPNLTTSDLIVTPIEDVEQGDVLTYTIILKNSGLVDDPIVTSTNTLPHNLDLLSIGTPSQGVMVFSGKSITWTTPLSYNAVATLTYRASISYKTSTAIRNTAYANDNFNDQLSLIAQTSYKIIPLYLPLIFKE